MTQDLCAYLRQARCNYEDHTVLEAKMREAATELERLQKALDSAVVTSNNNAAAHAKVCEKLADANVLNEKLGALIETLSKEAY